MADSVLAIWVQADAVGKAVALLLLGMSLLSWVLMVWKGWWLKGALTSLHASVQVLWQSPSWAAAHDRLQQVDKVHVLSPLVQAAQLPLPAGAADSLAAQMSPQAFYTRVLRDALAGVQQRLHYGQVVLATVGATAPFVGLLGTVWGIYHALSAIGDSDAFRLDMVAGPVGEALVMTAAGLAVAIPAVMAYNLLGRRIAAVESELEGVAHDLLAVLAPPRV
jgi:biopolymer transport protein ExbB